MSNTQTAVPEKPKLQMTFELTDSQPSSYVMDGPGIDDFDNLDMTPVISFPSLRMIRRTSRVKYVIPAKDGRPATFGYKKIRYIKGCPTIDFDEQVKMGVQPNYLDDLIKFSNGHLTSVREGDISLYDYLMKCEYNVDAPNRPDDAIDIFKQLDVIKDAKDEDDIADLKYRAGAILQELKIKNANGFSYKKELLEFYCSLFKMPKFESGFESEAWVALAQFADAQPAKFLNSLADSRSLTEAEVFMAVSTGVIIIDNVRAYFADGEGFIMAVDKDNTPAQNGNELVDFMCNPRNRNHYDTMRVKQKTLSNANSGIIK